jgi:hypothetical protein
VSRGTQIPEYVLQGCFAPFKSRNRRSLFVQIPEFELEGHFTAVKHDNDALTALKSVLPQFQCSFKQKGSKLTYASQQLGWSSGKAERLIA